MPGPDYRPEHEEVFERRTDRIANNTADSYKCPTCGAMFDVNNFEIASDIACPICGEHGIQESGRRLQSSDEGF